MDEVDPRVRGLRLSVSRKLDPIEVQIPETPTDALEADPGADALPGFRPLGYMRDGEFVEFPPTFYTQNPLLSDPPVGGASPFHEDAATSATSAIAIPHAAQRRANPNPKADVCRCCCERWGLLVVVGVLVIIAVGLAVYFAVLR